MRNSVGQGKDEVCEGAVRYTQACDVKDVD